MLFHTAFHQAITTRYILLKAALHSTALERYLDLDANQRDRIDKLRPLHLKIPNKIGVTESNAQPDEQVVDSEYFGFLRTEQLVQLDLVAFSFDGFAALTRSSLSTYVQLSDGTKVKIDRTIENLRDQIFLPRFRWEFAAPLPDDIKFRDCMFAGAFVTQVNLQIVDLLTDQECDRIQQLVVSRIDHEVIRELQKIATLPEGLFALARNLKEDEIYGTQPEDASPQ